VSRSRIIDSRKPILSLLADHFLFLVLVCLLVVPSLNPTPRAAFARFRRMVRTLPRITPSTSPYTPGDPGGLWSDGSHDRRLWLVESL